MKSEILTLYHGTTHGFEEIDVNKGKAYKDFGRGFYASLSKEHAVNMAFRNRDIELLRLSRQGRAGGVLPWLYTFSLDTGGLDNLSVKRFDSANREWVLFVTQNRTNNPHRHAYDVVIGPTANDRTNPTIQTYLNEGYGEVGSNRAIELLIELLLPYKLPFQYYFGTNPAAKCLVLVERCVLK